MSTEPKLGTCDHKHPSAQHPHEEAVDCVNWREGESASAQPVPHICETDDDITGNWRCTICGKYGNREAAPPAAQAHPTITLSQGGPTMPSGLAWLSDKTEPLLSSPQAEAAPPAVGTAMTAEQLPEPDTYGYVYPDAVRYSTFGRWINGSGPIESFPLFSKEKMLAYVAHVREAAQGDYDRNLRDRDRAIERWRTLAEAAQHNEANLREAVRRKRVKDSIIRELRRKLAELEKALAECLPILHGAVAHFKYKQASLAEQYEAVTKRAEAALASLRAESKEPVD